LHPIPRPSTHPKLLKCLISKFQIHLREAHPLRLTRFNHSLKIEPSRRQQQNDPHIVHREILTKARTHTALKWTPYRTVNLRFVRIEVSIREEGAWFGEVAGVVVDCVLADLDHLLFGGVAVGFEFEGGTDLF
jgi:hypothetical protein